MFRFFSPALLTCAYAIYSKVYGDAPNDDLATVANNLAISYGYGGP